MMDLESESVALDIDGLQMPKLIDQALHLVIVVASVVMVGWGSDRP